MKRNSIEYWTYERCKEEVSKYKNISEFRNKMVYKVILNNKWYEILDNKRIIKPKGYWTYEKCKMITSNYSDIMIFKKENGGAYYQIFKNNWYELFDHMRRLPNFYKRLIYVYEFSDNSCYIGLTCNIDRRNKQHLNEKDSPVYNYINDKKIQPKLVIISDYINIKDAVKMEKDIVSLYQKNNWNILNKNKTGSIGMTRLIWTKEKCTEEIKKYKTYAEFRKNSAGAHNSAFIHGWLYELLSKYIDGYIKGKTR